MEMTKKKWFTLLGFGAAVALPMSMIIHTANEGLKAAVITEEHREAVLSEDDGALIFTEADSSFDYDLNAHDDNKLVLNAVTTLYTGEHHTGSLFEITTTDTDDMVLYSSLSLATYAQLEADDVEADDEGNFTAVEIAEAEAKITEHALPQTSGGLFLPAVEPATGEPAWEFEEGKFILADIENDTTKDEFKKFDDVTMFGETGKEITGYMDVGSHVVTLDNPLAKATAIDNGLAVGAIYAAALATDGSSNPIEADDDVLTSYFFVDSIEDLEVTLSTVKPFAIDDEIETTFTFTPAEGYTFVRMHEDADNSQFGMDTFDPIRKTFTV